MQASHKNKMSLLILLQILVAIVNICNAKDESNPVVISSESLTKIPSEKVNEPSSSPAKELFDSLRETENDGNDLDFNYDDGEDTSVTGVNPDIKEQEMQEVLLNAMKKPAIRRQIGEVVPILRAMSPAQRLTLATLVSSQIMSQNTLSEQTLAEMLANKNLENKDNRYNVMEHLLLPISMDVAKMFKGLGKEMGRNLRQNFYRSSHTVLVGRPMRRVTRKPDFRNPGFINRRMDEVGYDDFEEKFSKNNPTAEALKQPKRDECDFFTKNLCLEVPNYPAEAIILSLKKNQEIAKTFLTDFEVYAMEESAYNSKADSNGRKLERRQGSQNKAQGSAPDGGYMCPSSVKYAKPKRARTTSGQWKYIVNAGDYSQTLRLEICRKPKSSCFYVTNHLNSQCTQIYNYHRLLTWDENKGLHMDIFKVPSCCSCHIQGYSTFFPPSQDFTYAERKREPSEGKDSVLELSSQSPYGYVGNKREVPKNVFTGSTLPIHVQNHSQISANTKEFFHHPVDHLVPPGPPLPLENEGVGNLFLESTYNQKKATPDSNRRYPVQAEFRRVINKVTESTDSLKELFTNNGLKAPIPAHETHPETVSGLAHGSNQNFDSTNEIHFLNPSAKTTLPFLSLEAEQENPSSSGAFVTPAPNFILQLGPKVKSNSLTQPLKPELPDNKGLPSRVSPFYLTPLKPGSPTRVFTTSKAPQKPPEFSTSGQKKINYNYHPIIDFFLPDTKKGQSSLQDIHSGPQYLPLSSQDWTPVVGH